MSYYKRVCRNNRCRHCINEKYGLNLQPRDCRYWHYLSECSHCKEVHNIVTDLTLSGIFKLFWHSLFHKKR